MIGSQDNVGCLWSFGTFHDLKFDGISFLQGAITVANNGGVMNEDIGAIITPDKTVPLGIVEPLHFALHLFFSSERRFLAMYSTDRVRPGRSIQIEPNVCGRSQQ